MLSVVDVSAPDIHTYCQKCTFLVSFEVELLLNYFMDNQFEELLEFTDSEGEKDCIMFVGC